MIRPHWRRWRNPPALTLHQCRIFVRTTFHQFVRGQRCTWPFWRTLSRISNSPGAWRDAARAVAVSALDIPAALYRNPGFAVPLLYLALFQAALAVGHVIAAATSPAMLLVLVMCLGGGLTGFVFCSARAEDGERVGRGLAGMGCGMMLGVAVGIGAAVVFVLRALL